MFYKINNNTLKCRDDEYYDDLRHILVKLNYPNSTLCNMINLVDKRSLYQKKYLENLNSRHANNHLSEKFAIAIEAVNNFREETINYQFNTTEAQILNDKVIDATSNLYQFSKEDTINFNDNFKTDYTCFGIFVTSLVTSISGSYLFMNYADKIADVDAGVFFLGTSIFPIISSILLLRHQHDNDASQIIHETYYYAQEINCLLGNVEMTLPAELSN